MFAPGTNGRRAARCLSSAESGGLKRRELLKVPTWTESPGASRATTASAAAPIIEYAKVVQSQINDRLVQFTVDRDGAATFSTADLNV